MASICWSRIYGLSAVLLPRGRRSVVFESTNLVSSGSRASHIQLWMQGGYQWTIASDHLLLVKSF